MLVYDLRGSGVVRNALRIAGAARNAGLDVRLWPVRVGGELDGAIPPELPVLPLHDGPARLPRDLDSLLSVPALARAIDARRPDLLFSSGNQMHVHAALAMRRAKRPVRFLGRASNAVVSAAGPGRAAMRPVERFQYKAMDRVIAVSGELAGDLAELGVERDRIALVPNGVDLARLETLSATAVDHPFFAPGAPPVVIGIGRLSHQKNFEGLVRAFAAARARRPLRLIILGGGNDRRLAGLRRLAARLGVADDVALPGFVANPIAFLARADLFVLNSRWEGASNVLLEALACGCPIVATRAPTGIAEVMEEGRIGPLVTVGDDQALATAMLERLDQPRGSAALKARAADFDLGSTLSAYVAILREESGLSAR
jgi:glycosyltransferase involved in cell wall biosynthesis